MDLDFILQSAKTVPLDLRHHAAKEALQRCLLSALARQGLLADVAFIGGTALRILHQLPRYSEDLDFLWTNTQSQASLGKWAEVLKRALTKIGTAGIIQTVPASTVDALVEKRSVTLHLIATSPAFNTFARHGLQISFEIDLNPPANTERETRTLQIAGDQVTIPTLALPSLMAGKLHILLTRKDREKGRDWFDYVWYRRNGILPQVPQLQSAIEQTAHGPEARYWMSYLRQRAKAVDWENIRGDVRAFLENKDEVRQLTEAGIAKLTPYPHFEAIAAELRELKEQHPLLRMENPVIQDLQQAALEGDDAALEARFAIEALGRL
jgi:hypothetical protein